MRPIQLPLCCIFLSAMIGCQPVSLDEGTLTANAPTPLALQTAQVEVVTSVPSQTPLAQAASENPATITSGVPWEDDQMPVFLEVTQTTMMGNNGVQSPTYGVGPSQYFYQPEIKVLMLHPTITLEPTTEVLVGLATILQTPGQVFDNREIVQFPSTQPTSINIASFDKNTEVIELAYGNERFDLSAGQSRTFKQVGDGSNTSTIITVISNHGRLTEIQQLSSDGSLR